MAHIVLTVDDEQVETVMKEVLNINGVDCSALLEEE